MDGGGSGDLSGPVAPDRLGALRRHLDEAEQRPHVEQSGESVAQRAGREIVGDPRLTWHGDAGGNAALPAEYEVTTVDEAESQPGVGDPSVERVEHGEGRGPRRLRREPGGHQRVEHIAGAGTR